MATDGQFGDSYVCHYEHAAAVRASPRLVSVDVLRGLVMVIMALDHTRDFMSSCGFTPRTWRTPTARSTLPALSLTTVRPYSHFSPAPARFWPPVAANSIQQVSWFFFTRGLWLVLLEFTVVDFAWGLSPGRMRSDLDSGLEHDRHGSDRTASDTLDRGPGTVMVATHNCSMRSIRVVREVLLVVDVPALARTHSDRGSFVLYQVRSDSLGRVMSLGFAFGKLLLRPDRRQWILTLGISATFLFFVLRGINLYGNGIAGLPLDIHGLPDLGLFSRRCR